MQLEKASKFDKNEIFKFCKNTFSWGDYIQEIWEYWLSEGNLSVIREHDLPVAVCHASISKSSRQVWIEGIRVNPDFRQRGHASTLIRHAEKQGALAQCDNSFMLIETNNKNSLSLSKKMGYKIKETWNFFSILPEKFTTIPTIRFVQPDSFESDFIASCDFNYVDSWRWYPLNTGVLTTLIMDQKIIYAKQQGKYSLAVITHSKHFSGTLILTLLAGTDSGIKKLVNYSKHLAASKNFKRIQILTKLNNLPYLSNFEKKLSFYLVWKQLQLVNS